MGNLSVLNAGKSILDILGGKTMLIMFWARRRRCDATNLGLSGPSPIAPRDRIPREGPPHLNILVGGCAHTSPESRPLPRLPEGPACSDLLCFIYVLVLLCCTGETCLGNFLTGAMSIEKNPNVLREIETALGN